MSHLITNSDGEEVPPEAELKLISRGCIGDGSCSFKSSYFPASLAAELGQQQGVEVISATPGTSHGILEHHPMRALGRKGAVCSQRHSHVRGPVSPRGASRGMSGRTACLAPNVNMNKELTHAVLGH